MHHLLKRTNKLMKVKKILILLTILKIRMTRRMSLKKINLIKSSLQAGNHRKRLLANKQINWLQGFTLMRVAGVGLLSNLLYHLLHKIPMKLFLNKMKNHLKFLKKLLYLTNLLWTLINWYLPPNQLKNLDNSLMNLTQGVQFEKGPE